VQPTVNHKLNDTALKGLNIRLVLSSLFNPSGVARVFLSLPWVAPTVIHIKPLRGKHEKNHIKKIKNAYIVFIINLLYNFFKS